MAIANWADSNDSSVPEIVDRFCSKPVSSLNLQVVPNLVNLHQRWLFRCLIAIGRTVKQTVLALSFVSWYTP